MLLPPPLSPLFPYTTLFRSAQLLRLGSGCLGLCLEGLTPGITVHLYAPDVDGDDVAGGADVAGRVAFNKDKVCPRSEEHTSELQSRGHLVCRLLLEKKK